MNPKRKAWWEKYKVNITEEELKKQFFVPGHVSYICSEDGTSGYFAGFDGTPKTWEQLTDEEKQDFQEQMYEATDKLLGIKNTGKDEENKDKNIGKEPGE